MPISLPRYAAIYILAMAALFILSIVLEQLAGIPIPSGLSTVIPPMMAAMIEGQRVAKAERRTFESDGKWRAAFKMTGVAIVINTIVAGLLMAFTDIGQAFAAAGANIVVSVAAFLIVLTLLVNRMFLATGIKQIERAARRGPGS